MEPEILLEARGVSKVYKTASGGFQALQAVSFQLRAGAMTAVTGKSGSGKSTLLNIVAAIDSPTTGAVTALGQDLALVGSGEIDAWRGANIGIVFQFFQLLPTLSILENVMLPMDFLGLQSEREQLLRATELLERMGIADQAAKFPQSLSGGQQQRAAVARALANDPPLIVADEPTGNLDSHNADSIMRLFRGLADEGRGVLIVTHETEYEHLFDQVITLSDGRLTQTGVAGGTYVATL